MTSVFSAVRRSLSGSSPGTDPDPKRVRHDSTNDSANASDPANANSFAVLADREPEPVEDLSSPPPKTDRPTPNTAQATSSKGKAPATKLKPAYNPAPSRPQKRSPPDDPSRMPTKRRGMPWFRHDDYEAYMRPAPSNSQDFLLWMDLQENADAFHAPVSPVTALAEAFDVVGYDAVGYVTASARSIGIIFPSEERRTKHLDAKLASGLHFYKALPQAAPIQRLTLQGVPVQDRKALITALHSLFESKGVLLEVVPLLGEGTQWASDTFHVTVSSTSADMLPETITLLGATVLVHVPGVRRVCLHCHRSEHAASCHILKRKKKSPEASASLQQSRWAPRNADKTWEEHHSQETPGKADKAWEEQTTNDIDDSLERHARSVTTSRAPSPTRSATPTNDDDQDSHDDADDDSNSSDFDEKTGPAYTSEDEEMTDAQDSASTGAGNNTLSRSSSTVSLSAIHASGSNASQATSALRRSARVLTPRQV